MAIPQEILNVSRPKNTRVKKNGNRYDVIKRTCVYKNGRRVPVEKGKVGEIIDGQYVEKSGRKLSMHNIDIKDYGNIKLCSMCSEDLLKELLNIYDPEDANKIYTIALLRSAYGNVTNRDLKYKYETSFLSEIIPDMTLSENTISSFMDLLGRNINMAKQFMINRLNSVSPDSVIVIDGMLKDCKVKTADFTQWSRKSRLKGSEDISVIYAFDLKTGEPIAHKIYPGNMLDSTSFKNFIEFFKLHDCLIMGDKGFVQPDTIDLLSDEEKKISYMFPIRRDSKVIKDNKLYEYKKTFRDNNDVISYVKIKIDNEYYYSYKSIDDETTEKKAYLINSTNKGNYSQKKLNGKKEKFGTIVFRSKIDIDPIKAYELYDRRWNIEVYFNFYKNIVGLDDVRVQGNTRVIGSEFINFLSSIISLRVKDFLIKSEIDKKYSFSQILDYVTQLKKYKNNYTKKWEDNNTLEYINNIAKKLNLK